MRRSLILLLLPACDPTLTPDPPAPIPYTVTSFATAHTRTLAATSLATTADNVAWHGSPVPQPTDEEGEELPLGLPLIARVAVGKRHACAISTTGTVHCWGDHTGGALGAHRACTPPDTETGEPNCVLGQDEMPTLPPMRAIAAGDDVTCAIALDGDRVACWGNQARTGGSRVPVLDEVTPVQAGGSPLEAERLMAFGGAICAIDTAGALWCWGDRFGAAPLRQPQQGVVDLAIGRRHTCMIDAQGLSCWGDNTNGQIGDVEAARSCGDDCVIAEPRAIPIANAARVVVGERHTCALDRAGNVSCWGSNEVGQLGRDDVFLVGGIAPILTNIVELQSGYSHSCALGNDSSLWCWGSTSQRDPSEVSL